ncbi:hypothetical protein BX661DRAFT_178638 [Kickxella alabastrina]|uniref:uncharacterized protein n=1 Tax=Kickxella alabastrina TaxID=61397 RepID=UPI00221FCE66|nr:uncharacterized protein BX661DRAFT_178638 [Kickxella alabastrina]KAI7833571.1 hypothetical protein BX661DRAFT_178638 [Kickxella alabastrina]KAJ1945511.1 hypothetical protein GGF37_001661 [Kickxella alabastrina]
MAKLTDLPYELLTQLLIISANESLVTVCRWTYICLRKTTPRICYKFVRQKGMWEKTQVIASALPYKFLSVELLDQIIKNEAELVPKHNGKHKRLKSDNLGDLKIPNRLFHFDPDGKMPVNINLSKKQKRANIQNDSNQVRFDIVKCLLSMKLSVKGARGNTGLLLSAKAGNLTLVRMLLKRGADPQVGRDNKALLMAVVYGHLPVIRRLVKTGAPLTPLALRYAVQKKHYKIVAWLMKRGVVPDMMTIKLLDKL